MGSFFFLTLQKSLVRTIIEYTFPVSNPNFVRDIFLLEQVQKKYPDLPLTNGEAKRLMKIAV